MRILLFFDLPTLTSAQRKTYRHFVKDIVRLGYYRLQESVFCKMAVNLTSANASFSAVSKIKPSEGNVFALIVTEKQFSSMRIFVGENKADVITSFDRIVELW